MTATVKTSLIYSFINTKSITSSIHASATTTSVHSSTMTTNYAKTRRLLSSARSRHPARTQRNIVFAFRQRQNTQRVVVRASTTPRAHAEGARFRVSTTPKHAEGCPFSTFFTKCGRLPPTLPRALQHIDVKRETHQIRHAVHRGIITPSITSSI